MIDKIFPNSSLLIINPDFSGERIRGIAARLRENYLALSLIIGHSLLNIDYSKLAKKKISSKGVLRTISNKECQKFS